MASDIDRLIIDLQARLGGAESTIKQLGDVVKNLNRFALGGIFGAGTAPKYAIWRSSVELQDSAFLKDAADAVETTGDILPATDLGASLGFDDPVDHNRFLTCFAETFLHDWSHGILWGTGDPTPTGSAVVADVGTIYLQKDGTEGEMAWFKEADDGAATGWTPGFFDGADRYLSNLALTDELDPHTSLVQINADLLPGTGLEVDIGSLGEAFHDLFLSHVYTGTLGSFGTALDPTTPVPIGLIDSIIPAGGLSLGSTDNPFLDVFSTEFLFETGVGIFHGATDPALGTMTGYGPGWLYVQDDGELWIKNTPSTSAVWTQVGSGGPGSVGPGIVNRLSKFTPDTSSIGSANIVDDGVNVSLIHTADDWVQLGFATTDTVPEPDESHLAIWRYDHRPEGLVDEGPTGSPYHPNSASGEMQLFLNSSTSCVRLGEGRSYFTTGLAFKTPVSYPYGAITVADTSAVTNFEVWPDGNLAIIKYQKYDWPDSVPDPTDPTPTTKVLGYASLTSGGAADLQWVDRGSGTSTGSGIVLGTIGTLGMFTAAEVIGNSRVVDDGSAIIATCKNLISQYPLDAVNGDDLAQVGFQTHPGKYAIWRYEHRPVGIVGGSNLVDGEMQLFLNNPTNPSVWLGANRSFFRMGIEIIPLNSYTDSVFSVNDEANNVKFEVSHDGDLSNIKSNGYSWPSNPIPTPAGETRVLGYSTITGAKAILQWFDLTTAAGNVSTTIGGNNQYIPKFTASHNIENSAIKDDGAGIIMTNRDLLVIGAAGADQGQIGLMGDSGGQGIMRYAHTFLADPDNATGSKGEIQFYLNPTGSPSPEVFFGARQSWFQTGVRIRPVEAYTNPSLEIHRLISGVDSSVFRVETDGNLALIKGQPYVWPASSTTTAGFVLSNTGTGGLQWVAPGGAGIAGLTDLKVPRWSTAAGALVNSAIEDRTSTVGTIEFLCKQLLFRRPPTAPTPDPSQDDLSDFYMRTGMGNNAIWRYEHRAGFPPGGVADTANSGEVQLHFDAFNTTPLILGPVHSWFQGGVRIRPTTANTGTVVNAFEVQDTGGTPRLAIGQDGNLSKIALMSYDWPVGPVSPPTSTVLTHIGSGTLRWLPGGNISTTVGGGSTFIPKFTGSNTIENSVIKDDGVGLVSLDRRDLLVIGAWPGGVAADQSQLQLRANSGAEGIMRYAHTYLADSGNASGSNGEMQFFLNGPAPGSSPHVFLGAQYSWFQMPVRVRPTYGNPNHPFEIHQIDNPGGSLIHVPFRVRSDGDLSIIRNMAYTWPAGPATGAATYPTAGMVLTTGASGALSWAAPSGGLSGGNTFYTARWTSPTTIGPSTVAYDDGNSFQLKKDLLVFSGSGALSIGAAGQPFTNVYTVNIQGWANILSVWSDLNPSNSGTWDMGSPSKVWAQTYVANVTTTNINPLGSYIGIGSATTTVYIFFNGASRSLTTVPNGQPVYWQ